MQNITKALALVSTMAFAIKTNTSSITIGNENMEVQLPIGDPAPNLPTVLAPDTSDSTMNPNWQLVWTELDAVAGEGEECLPKGAGVRDGTCQIYKYTDFDGACKVLHKNDSDTGSNQDLTDFALNSYNCGDGVRYEFRKTLDEYYKVSTWNWQHTLVRVGHRANENRYPGSGIKFAILGGCKEEPAENSCQVYEHKEYRGQCWSYSLGGQSEKTVPIYSHGMSSYKCHEDAKFEFKDDEATTIFSSDNGDM